MNQNEAMEEAVRRWGKDAHVRYGQGQLSKDTMPYAVGRWKGKTFERYGQGQTWEEAFQDADKRKPAADDAAANDNSATWHAGIRPKSRHKPKPG
jgi:hypothetical protein